MKKEVLEARIAMLKAMDEYVRNSIGDERIIYTWLMLGVPDGAYEDDYEYIAEDHDSWQEIVELFADLVKREVEEDY